MHMHIHTGPPGNVRWYGPVRPSGLTDSLALFRYLKVVLISWEACFITVINHLCNYLYITMLFGYQCLNEIVSGISSIRPSYIASIMSQKKELANKSACVSMRQEKCDNICIISSELAHFHLFDSLFCKNSGFCCISSVVVEKIPSEE